MSQAGTILSPPAATEQQSIIAALQNLEGALSKISDQLLGLVTVSVPQDPATLDEFLLVDEDTAGQVYSYIEAFPLTVPAADGTTQGTVSFSTGLPDGYVAKVLRPPKARSTNQAAAISVGWEIDGASVVGPNGLYLGPDVEVGAAAYGVARSTGQSLTLSNSITQPVIVWVQASLIFIRTAFYEDTYQKIIQRPWRITATAAKQS